MKKMICLILCAFLLCSALTACGGGPGASTKDSSGATTDDNGILDPDTNSPYTYVLNGVSISTDDEMAPLLEQLGEPTEYFESESCAFQGLDKVYTYDNVTIYTYPSSGVDYVLSIALFQGAAATPEGIQVGSTRDAVLAAYGEPLTSSSTALVYGRVGCTLTFILENDTVTTITYTANVF